MKYSMTDNAKATRQNVNAEIIKALREGVHSDSKFRTNMNELKGVLYNPITQTAIGDKKVIEILAQAEKVTDPRFVTFRQATEHGMHVVKDAKSIDTVNFTIEETSNGKGEREQIAKGRIVKYFDAKQVSGMEELGEPLGTYSAMDQIKLTNNLNNRVNEVYNGQVKSYERSKENGENRNPPMPLVPKKLQNFMNKMDEKLRKAYVVYTYSMRNTQEFMGMNKQFEKEYLSSKEGEKKEAHNIEPEEREIRKEFREVLGASLLAREIGDKPIFDAYLENREVVADKLASIYEQHPEKLSHDMQAAVKSKEMVKEKVMFMTRARKSKEEIKAMEEDFKNNPENKGKTLSATSYYHYTAIDVQKAEDRIKSNDAMRSKVQTKAIQKAKETYAKTLDTQVKNLELAGPDIAKISTALVNKIAESRKNLGLESDPKKFMKDYVTMNVAEDGTDKYGKKTVIMKPMSYFKVNEQEIRDKGMTHEQILNRFANGKEGESVDIMSHVKEDQAKKAEVNAVKKLQRQAGDAARAKAAAKSKAKQNWKANEVSKAKAKTTTRKPRKTRSAGKDME